MKRLKNIIVQENNFKNIIKYVLSLTNSSLICSEVVVEKISGINISIRNSNVELIEFNKDYILTITIYKNNRTAVVSSTDLSFKSIKKIVCTAMDIVTYSSIDKFSGLPDRQLLAIGKIKDLNLFHNCKWDINDTIELIKLSEQEAFQENKYIVNTEGANFNSCIRTYAFGNSLGMIECYSTTLYSISCCVIAERYGNMQRDFSFSVSRDVDDLYSPKKIGRDSARKAMSRLNPKKIPTMKVPIIFSSEIASEFFLHFAKAISGNCVYQKSTFLLNDLNTAVFPSWLTIEEHPHLEKGLSSRCFDSEGVETKLKKIVDRGVLKTWLLDTYSARKINSVSTGNAGGIHNWLVLGYSNMCLKKLLGVMNTGILITELLGEGVSITTGNYSRGAVGFWIDNGVLKYPVNEITISGNLREMFKNVSVIGNDIDKRHSIQSGSVLLSSIQVSGL